MPGMAKAVPPQQQGSPGRAPPIIKPNPGPQTLFSQLGARISIFGGQAGGGKSFALLANALRYIAYQNYFFAIFRRESVQIDKKGGLWDESMKLYPAMGGRGNRQRHEWQFPAPSSGQFGHMENSNDYLKWDGSQISYIGFDELQHFTELQFWYMLSRNRNASGLPCFVRGSCNPKPNCWLSSLLQWWWDPETGYPIKKRSGKVRWLLRFGEDIHWGESKLELIARFAPEFINDPDNPKNPVRPVSFTFIMSSLDDNPIYRENMEYRSGLMLLPRVEQERLLKGNWKIVPSSGDYFPRDKVEIVDAAPQCIQVARCWDQAATKPSSQNPDPDWTASLKMGVAGGQYFILDAHRFREDPAGVNRGIANLAGQDGQAARIGLFQDPGSAGKALFASQAAMLAGKIVIKLATTRDKETQALPLSAQWGAGNVKIVRGPWNEAFLEEMNRFGSGEGHDDWVDAASGAFLMCRTRRVGPIGASI